MRPVVLVPGLLGTASHFARCHALWAHPVVDFPLPGHGGAPDVPDHPARVAVDQLRAVLTAQPEPPLVVGLSYLGAAVALRAAEGIPDAVHGVVLSGYSLIVTPETLGRWLAAFSAMAVDQPHSGAHFATLHGPQWQRLLRATTAELDDGCLVLPQQADVAALAVPLLLINGALLENERLAVQPAAEAGADVAIVAGAGHLVPQDSPRAFVAGVEEFAQRITEGRSVFQERRRRAARAGERTSEGRDRFSIEADVAR